MVAGVRGCVGVLVCCEGMEWWMACRFSWAKERGAAYIMISRMKETVYGTKHKEGGIPDHFPVARHTSHADNLASTEVRAKFPSGKKMMV